MCDALLRHDCAWFVYYVRKLCFVIRETFLQALRCCVLGAGAKLSEKVRGDVTSLLTQLLASQEDAVRTTAAAALGSVTVAMSDSEMRDVMRVHLLDADDKCDWCLRHGRCLALSVAILTDGEKMMTSEFEGEIEEVSLAHAQADKVSAMRY